MENHLSSPRLDLSTNSTAQRSVRDYHARLPPARKVAGGLGILPWHLLPTVDHLQRDPRNSNDFRDGVLIPPSMITEAETVLSAFVKLTIASRGVNMRRLDRMGAICLILQIINAPHLLGRFLEERTVDASLPLSKARLIGILRDGDAALDFLGEQYRAKPRQIVPLQHIEFEETEPMPYLVQRNIGTGGYGKVDQVEDITTGKVYAMKSWKNVDQNAKARLLEEASVLKKLTNSKHVVRLINTYGRGKLLGLVMDPVATCDLNDLIEARPRDRAWAIPILTQAPGCLAAALADIHALKIRHKDISPRNILLCHDNILLTDFGLSIDVSEMSRTDTSGPTARTVNYCSPEVALQQSRGRKSDVFSLGCVILVILSLLPPNSADWLEDVLSFRPFHLNLERVENWIQKRTTTSSDGLPNTWLRICRWMIREDPSTRPTMQTVLEDILSDPSLEEWLPSLFCSDCLAAKNTSNLAAIRHQRKVSAEDFSSSEVLQTASDTLLSLTTEEPVMDGSIFAHSDIDSYLEFCKTLSAGLSRHWSDGVAESLTIFFSKLFIPDCGIHPQVMNATCHLRDSRAAQVRKGCNEVKEFGMYIPGYWVAFTMSSRTIRDMFEDTAKWYFENGENFGRGYIHSETYQRRKDHGPGPLPKTKGEWLWLASTYKDWRNRMVTLHEQTRAVEINNRQSEEEAPSSVSLWHLADLARRGEAPSSVPSSVVSPVLSSDPLWHTADRYLREEPPYSYLSQPLPNDPQRHPANHSASEAPLSVPSWHPSIRDPKEAPSSVPSWHPADVGRRDEVPPMVNETKDF